MKTFFSWLKKSVEDAERVSSGASALVCLILLAGTIVLAAEKTWFVPAREAAEESAENVPARIAVRLENFVPAPEISEIENAPEETPPAPEIPAAPEPPKEKPQQETPVPEQIDESAIREIAEPVPVPEEPPPEPEKLPEPEEPNPEQQVQQAAPTPPVPVARPAENRAAKIAAEQTLYGVLAEAIRREKFYPRAARRSGYTGTVSLRVEIDGAGKIKAFEISSSGAHRLLQSGAMKTLRRVAENFLAPAGTHSVLPAVFIVPIVYELN